MAKMTVGPVIGKVTETTARILVEADGDATVTCTLTGADQTVRSDTKALRADRAAAFSLTGLTPGTPYSAAFSGLTDSRIGRVVTPRLNETRLTIAAVSCNNTPMRGDTELWADLFDKYVAPGD